MNYVFITKAGRDACYLRIFSYRDPSNVCCCISSKSGSLVWWLHSLLWSKQRALVACFKLYCVNTMSDFVDFYYRMWFQLVNIFFYTWQVSLVRQIRCNLQLLFKWYTDWVKLAIKVVLSAMSYTWLIAELKLILTEVIIFLSNRESQVTLKFFFSCLVKLWVSRFLWLVFWFLFVVVWCVIWAFFFEKVKLLGLLIIWMFLAGKTIIMAKIINFNI